MPVGRGTGRGSAQAVEDVRGRTLAAAKGALHLPVPVAGGVLARKGQGLHRPGQLVGVEREACERAEYAPCAHGSSRQVERSGAAPSSSSSGRSAATEATQVPGPAHTRSRSSAPGVPANEAANGAGPPSGPSCVYDQ